MPESAPLLGGHSGSQPESHGPGTVLSRVRERMAAACENKTFHLTLVSLVNLRQGRPLSPRYRSSILTRKHTPLQIVIAGVCDLTPLLATAIYCEDPNVPSWLERLELISNTIVFVFLLEILVNLFAFGFRFYITRPLNLLDAVVVIADFVLSVGLRGSESQAAGLLVFLRLWRIIKLVEESVEATAEVGEERVHGLLEELEAERARSKLLEAQLESYRRELQHRND
jgi:Ion transport protein